MYGTIDLFVVGRLGGEHAEEYVSEVSTGSQVMHALTSASSFVQIVLCAGLFLILRKKRKTMKINMIKGI